MAYRGVLICVFLLTALPSGVFSQDYERIKGIKQKLAATKEAMDQFALLGDLAFEYRFAHPDSTIYYSQKAYELGVKLNLKMGLARPFNFMGVAHNYKGDRLAAYEAYAKALEIATAQKDTLQIAHAENNIGRVLFDQGLLSRSYDHFLDAIPLFESLQDSTGMAYGYQSLANLYRTQRDYAKSEEFFVKALAIRLKLKRTRDIMSAYTYLGRLYNEWGDYAKATDYYLKADSGYSITHDEINLAETRIFLAENYIEDNKVKEAEEIFKRGYEVISKSKVVRFQPRAHITLGKIDFLKGDYEGAKAEFDIGLAGASDIKDIALQMEAHLYLSKVAEKQANPSAQLNNYNKYLILKDSLKDLDVARQVERLQFELQIEKKEQENKLLKIKEERNNAIITQQRYQNIALFAIAFSLLIVATLIWRNSRRNAAANAALAKQNAEIESQRIEILKQNQELANQNLKLSELNNEKDTLMSIVAHDLKSPLNRIKGLLEVIRLEPSGLNEDKLKLLKMIETSTQAGVELITDLLDVHEIEENRNVINASIDIPAFLRSRLDNFRSVAIAKGIDIKLDEGNVGEIQSDVEYLSRILDNLLSNAIKFSNKGSVIQISSGRDETFVWISVKDQGPGFQDLDKTLMYQKFKRLSARPTGGESSNGLGLAIVKILIDRLKGEIILDTASGKGSEFIIKFPGNN